MATRFHAVFLFAGVDDQAETPGMIVPVGGSNIVAVELQSGEQLKSTRPADITIAELRPDDLSKKDFSYETLFGLPAFAAYREAPVRASPPSGCRFFRIGVRKKIAISQTIGIQAKDGKILEKMKVVGLDRKVVKVAIRPVTVPGPDGKGQDEHARKPYVLADIIAQMNRVWHPQANLVFTLVPSSSFAVSSLPGTVPIESYRELFAKAREVKARYTMFLVQAVTSKGHDDNGVSDVGNGFALLADRRSEWTAAHEAGHLMGSGSGPTGPMTFGHPTKDPDRLMRDGGANRRLTFDEVVSHFNGNY